MLSLGLRKIQCYVLEDGTAVLSGRGMQDALNLGQSHGTKLAGLLAHKAIKKHIDNELAMVLENPIRLLNLKINQNVKKNLQNIQAGFKR